MDKDMDLGTKNGQMEQSMKDIGVRIKPMEMASFGMLMVMFMMVSCERSDG